MSATSRVYSSRAIANYLLGLASDKGGLSQLQTIKMTYIAHGFALGAFDDPLIEDDIEAWKFGPVVRPVYAMLPAGSDNIVGSRTDEMPEFTARDKNLVDRIFDGYHRLGGIYLSSLTHIPGTPWDLTWKRYGQNAIIPRELIRDHYKRVIAGGSAAIAAIGL